MNYIQKSQIRLKPNSPNSHKGQNGRLLLVGGSDNYVGAVILAGMAAFSTGIDMVTIVAPEKVAWAINCQNPNFITPKFRGNHLTSRQIKEITRLAQKNDAILIGNGIGTKSSTNKLVNNLVALPTPKVIDADAIKATQIQKISNAIITPHQTEYSILLKNSKLTDENMQQHLRENVLLLKGRIDTIVTRTKRVYNRTGNQGMTVGGTGDCLAGLCAGFVAKGYSLFDAACYAAYLNGYAGDILFKLKGDALLATDIVDILPYILKKFYPNNKLFKVK
ncbi:MAG: NAD(P)H-hydrate dehydratase [Candidatus Woesearchaeota archaeon]